MAIVRLPAMLAQEAGAPRFAVEASTLGEALEALPVAELVLDERGRLRPLVNVFVDGTSERDVSALLAPDAVVIVVAAVAGG
jgi:hypothetical protein